MYKKQLSSLILLSLEKRRLMGSLIAALHNVEAEGQHRALVSVNRSQGNGMKLQQGKFRLYIRKAFFTERMIGQWNRLPMEVLIVSSMPKFKKHSDNSQTCSQIFGWSCVKPVEPDDLYGSLPT